jgi:hypothetical protein
VISILLAKLHREPGGSRTSPVTDEKAGMDWATGLDDRRGKSTLSTTLIAGFALVAMIALILPLHLPIGPNNWDTLVYYDAINRIRAGQVPNVDFFAPVGPLGYYLATLLDGVFPRAQPMLLVNWALLPVLLPSMALLAGHVAARSRGQALALLLPFLLFASLPINLHAIYPISGFDGYGHYNRHIALLLYVLVATLIFARDRRLLVGLVALLMLTLFLVKITGAVSGALLVGYAVLVGRLRLMDAVLAAALVLASLGALDLATGMVWAYVDDILTLLLLNSGSLSRRFMMVASLNLNVVAPCVLLLGALALAGWRESAEPVRFRMRSLGDSPAGLARSRPDRGIPVRDAEYRLAGIHRALAGHPACSDRLAGTAGLAGRPRAGAVHGRGAAGPVRLRRAQRQGGARQPRSITRSISPISARSGHVSVKAEIAERAPIMLEHYATHQAELSRSRSARADAFLHPVVGDRLSGDVAPRTAAGAGRDPRLGGYGTGRRLNGVFTLDFVDPLNRLLGREPARHVPIGVDPARTNPPLTRADLAALEGIDAILQPKCPLTVNRATIATHFARALQGRRRVALSNCWDMFLKN